ncbi:hypothetical protein Nepgr_017397 [Nepenthes gracilis]|uniref:Uncharacterized protein n=1 Tax=Nepenthes gracilis TaxID=150966 RepID=A0AAD3XTB5_NEPGR|nr:hypothetical protein Nepgr_017397 [Nepenthes gracilis]
MLQNHHAAGHKPTCISSKHRELQKNDQHHAARLNTTTGAAKKTTAVASPSRGSHQISFHQHGFRISSMQLNISAWSWPGSVGKKTAANDSSLYSSSISEEKKKKQPRIATLGPKGKANGHPGGASRNQEQRPSAYNSCSSQRGATWPRRQEAWSRLSNTGRERGQEHPAISASREQQQNQHNISRQGPQSSQKSQQSPSHNEQLNSKPSNAQV